LKNPRVYMSLLGLLPFTRIFRCSALHPPRVALEKRDAILCHSAVKDCYWDDIAQLTPFGWRIGGCS
jgi:hypothetical protein